MTRWIVVTYELQARDEAALKELDERVMAEAINLPDAVVNDWIEVHDLHKIHGDVVVNYSGNWKKGD